MTTRFERGWFLAALLCCLGLVNCHAGDIPQPYVKKGECPGEGCHFGEWKTIKEAVLFKSPTDQQIVGKVGPGQVVTAETGDNYITPVRIDVLADHTESASHGTDDSYIVENMEFKTGDVFFWIGGYDAEEGYVISYKGKKYTPQNRDGPSLEFDPKAFRKCKERSAICWARITDARDPEAWWVKVKTASGLSGWVHDEGQFRVEDQYREGL